MKNLVTNGFKKKSVDKLLTFSSYVYEQMNTNVATFETPDPSLGDLKALHDDLAKAKVEAGSGDRIKSAFLDVKKMEMVDFLQRIALYVNVVANGSVAVALLSGMDVRKTAEPRVLTVPGTPKVKRAAEVGSLDASCGTQAAATGHLWFMTSDATLPKKDWTLVKNGTSKVTFTDCEPGVAYHIYVVILGPRKQQFTSPVAVAVA